jgi:hypothetical protein
MTSIKLSTPVSIPKSDASITHQTPILLIGSCFAENMGNQLIDHKFDVHLNPNGILFNPISVANSLTRILKNQPYTIADLKEHNGKWFSFEHHSRFSSFDQRECLTQMNNALTQAHEHLKKTKSIFITFGSAWVYEAEGFGIVANCHKIPTKQFTKRLLSVKEILVAFEAIKESLKEYSLVFTVSPVRHVKEGLHENNLSKSTLLLAINNWIEQNENSSYFPAYEIIIDELRDYRFYKDDLVHPTDLAVNYIWDNFTNCYFEKLTQDLNVKIQQLKMAANHKPFHFESEEHQIFIKKQLQLINDLSKKHSFLNFEKEQEALQNI